MKTMTSKATKFAASAIIMALLATTSAEAASRNFSRFIPLIIGPATIIAAAAARQSAARTRCRRAGGYISKNSGR